MSTSAGVPQSGSPFSSGTPPEIPPPWTPPDKPLPTPGCPPVPIVFDAPAPPDDLADRLLERRIVMVNGRLDLTRANEAAARLMLLDGCGDDPIQLVLSCPDGDLIAATALADTVELVGVEVRTVASGVVVARSCCRSPSARVGSPNRTRPSGSSSPHSTCRAGRTISPLPPRATATCSQSYTTASPLRQDNQSRGSPPTFAAAG